MIGTFTSKRTNLIENEENKPSPWPSTWCVQPEYHRTAPNDHAKSGGTISQPPYMTVKMATMPMVLHSGQKEIRFTLPLDATQFYSSNMNA